GTVEDFLKGERIAAQLRSHGKHRLAAVADAMPSSHRGYADWTVERIRREAAAIGPATAALCELILERRPHPEQGFRSCLGIVRLVRPFGAERLESAATRAIEIGTLTYGSVRSILDNKLDRQAAQRPPADAVPVLHPNIRGPRYYHRRDKRLATRLRYARLRHHAVVEDVDYRAPRGLDRALFHKLAGGEWIDAHDNLILCGPTGVGKSWLACALGHKACRDNRSVLYQRVPKLFADLALARGDGRYARIMRSLNGAQLLILDDWGLDPLDAGARRDLYEILEER